MIIIYACFSGTHAAVIAGAFYLGLLNPGHLPDWQQLKKLPHFDAPEGRGGLRYLGRTGTGLAIYTAAVGHNGETARRAVQTLLAALGRNQGEVLWVDVSRQVSFLWRLAGFCRRYSRLAVIRRLLLLWSLRRDYATLVRLGRKLPP